MPEVSLARWNEFLHDHPNAHLLQTGEWGELKAAFGWDPVRAIQGDIGAQILFRRLPIGFTIGYIPRGPISDANQKRDRSFLEEVESICRRRRAVFCKLEPDAWEHEEFESHLTWPFSQFSIQPMRTIVVDLRVSEENILARMKQKTRYNIGLSRKKGVRVNIWQDIDSFHNMVAVTGKRDGFGVHSLAYYRHVYNLFQPSGMCELFKAEYEGSPIAALMVFARGRRAWYFYGASAEEERNRMPTYPLQWEAMCWAKRRGCEEYDLWGVPDEDEATLESNFETRHDGLWGVYRFKRGFGGNLMRSAQPLDKVFNPLLYKLYLWRMAGREGG